MTLKSVIYSMIYLVLFVLLIYVAVDLRERINNARLTQSVEPQIIYGTVEELKR
jgi:hypothetical protein